MSNPKEIKSPSDHLASWHFHIIPEHWETIGIQRAQLIDKHPTKQLREKLIAEGMSKKDAMRHKITRRAYTQRDQYQFDDGYLFWTKNNTEAIQVLRVDSDTIEAAHITGPARKMRSAYRLRTKELLDWLRTGQAPTTRQISRYELSSEIMKYLVTPQEDTTP
ncbi:MAG: hypothetical protein IBX58_14415 [Roseovarius sp.]|nr:hypothetical protein [Roseovarius sp.]